MCKLPFLIYSFSLLLFLGKKSLPKSIHMHANKSHKVPYGVSRLPAQTKFSSAKNEAGNTYGGDYILQNVTTVD